MSRSGTSFKLSVNLFKLSRLSEELLTFSPDFEGKTGLKLRSVGGILCACSAGVLSLKFVITELVAFDGNAMSDRNIASKSSLSSFLISFLAELAFGKLNERAPAGGCLLLALLKPPAALD